MQLFSNFEECNASQRKRYATFLKGDGIQLFLKEICNFLKKEVRNPSQRKRYTNNSSQRRYTTLLNEEGMQLFSKEETYNSSQSRRYTIR